MYTATAIISPLKGTGAKSYFALANILLQQGKLGRSVFNYASVFTSLGLPQSHWRRSQYPQSEYILNQDYKFIYCPIPKVACSSLKRWTLQLSNLSDKEAALLLSNDELHAYVHHHLSLSAVFSEKTEADKLLHSSDYFKFAFVRNPWSRLVSGYINKFVDPLKLSSSQRLPDNARDVVEDALRVQEQNLHSQNEISFRNFLEYVCDKRDDELDGHWKSQYLFLSELDFDFIGRLENLESDFRYVQEHLNLPLKLPQSNTSGKRSEAFSISLDGKPYADFLPSDLLALTCFPDYRCFYDDYLKDLVRSRFSRDIELFKYDFDSFSEREII